MYVRVHVGMYTLTVKPGDQGQRYQTSFKYISTNDEDRFVKDEDVYCSPSEEITLTVVVSASRCSENVRVRQLPIVKMCHVD